MQSAYTQEQRSLYYNGYQSIHNLLLSFLNQQEDVLGGLYMPFCGSIFVCRK
jgi:hypothetical protein